MVLNNFLQNCLHCHSVLFLALKSPALTGIESCPDGGFAKTDYERASFHGDLHRPRVVETIGDRHSSASTDFLKSIPVVKEPLASSSNHFVTPRINNFATDVKLLHSIPFRNCRVINEPPIHRKSSFSAQMRTQGELPVKTYFDLCESLLRRIHDAPQQRLTMQKNNHVKERIYKEYLESLKGLLQLILSRYSMLLAESKQ